MSPLTRKVPWTQPKPHVRVQRLCTGGTRKKYVLGGGGKMAGTGDKQPWSAEQLLSGNRQPGLPDACALPPPWPSWHSSPSGASPPQPAASSLPRGAAGTGERSSRVARETQTDLATALPHPTHSSPKLQKAIELVPWSQWDGLFGSQSQTRRACLLKIHMGPEP